MGERTQYTGLVIKGAWAAARGGIYRIDRLATCPR